MSNGSPEAIIGESAFGYQAVDMGIPFKIPAKGVKDTDEARDKFPLIASWTTVYGSAKGRIAAVDHFVHVFNHGLAWVQKIYHFFIMVRKNLLEDVHMIIMKDIGTKRNPPPQE